MRHPQKLNRREVVQAVVGLAGLAVPSAPAAVPTAKTATAMSANPVVETASGKVRGYANHGVAVFRGIPYGASTTGENRFMPPAKAEPWSGIRNCLSYGHSCPEAGSGSIENDKARRNTDEDAFLLYRTNGWIRGEDCLRLNVWTPSTASSDRKRPVMIYMPAEATPARDGAVEFWQNVRIRERVRLQVRAEFFNVFNRTVMPNPSAGNPLQTQTFSATGVPTAGFGRIDATSVSGQRNGQLVGRIEW